MAVHPLAGQRARSEMLINVERLLREYYDRRPDPGEPSQRVKFGTSGHRGKPGDGSFNEWHILSIAQAVCDYRKSAGIGGPLFLGKDTHALSSPAQQTALEVLAANRIETRIQAHDGVTPIPAISRAILVHNLAGDGGLGDGVIISPSHNPPGDGGIKYNPPNGGPAETSVTEWIERRANELLAAGNREVKRVDYGAAKRAETTREHDFTTPYVRDLARAIDMEAIRGAGLRLGADPLGGASAGYWEPIERLYGLDIEVVNATIDPTFSFMPMDYDGKIRMDCSSPYAMANLVGLKDRFDLAFGNDPDADRHGIVTPSAGLLNPNHYLAAAVEYLLGERREWPVEAKVGKTLVSSSMIDRVVKARNRRLCEVPVGFKWFAAGLYDGSLCFGGEESAGASFLERDHGVWTTDKDGLVMDLLAAEMTAKTGIDPGERFEKLAARFGMPYYRREDLPATAAQKEALEQLQPEAVEANELGGEPIIAKLTRAPGNGARIGGLKVVAENGWFAVRPSGTEDICKIYAESFRGEGHLEAILGQAREIVAHVEGGRRG